MVSEKTAKYTFANLCDSSTLLEKTKSMGCVKVSSLHEFQNCYSGIISEGMIAIEFKEDDFDPNEWTVVKTSYQKRGPR